MLAWNMRKGARVLPRVHVRRTALGGATTPEVLPAARCSEWPWALEPPMLSVLSTASMANDTKKAGEAAKKMSAFGPRETNLVDHINDYCSGEAERRRLRDDPEKQEARQAELDAKIRELDEKLAKAADPNEIEELKKQLVDRAQAKPSGRPNRGVG